MLADAVKMADATIVPEHPGDTPSTNRNISHRSPKSFWTAGISPKTLVQPGGRIHERENQRKLIAYRRTQAHGSGLPADGIRRRSDKSDPKSNDRRHHQHLWLCPRLCLREYLGSMVRRNECPPGQCHHDRWHYRFDVASNEGAYNAGGISVGIPAKFKIEVGGKPNGYQTHIIPTRDFYVRMELLKKANAFVVMPGGIGTFAEGTDTITHVQTEKMPQYLMEEFTKGEGAPVYLVGKRYWSKTVKALEGFVKDGRMDAKHLNLFTVVDDPREIFKDLARRKAALAAAKLQAPKDSDKEPATSETKPA